METKKKAMKSVRKGSRLCCTVGFSGGCNQHPADEGSEAVESSSMPVINAKPKQINKAVNTCSS
jgi:hypothetical protein